MKVKTLIKELKKLNPELEVVLSSDQEGNSFHLLQDIEEYHEDEEIDEELGFSEYIVLWP